MNLNEVKVNNPSLSAQALIKERKVLIETVVNCLLLAFGR
jgi:hypothetical protein